MELVCTACQLNMEIILHINKRNVFVQIHVGHIPINEKVKPPFKNRCFGFLANPTFSVIVTVTEHHGHHPNVKSISKTTKEARWR
jgi:hypothetical protein